MQVWITRWCKYKVKSDVSLSNSMGSCEALESNLLVFDSVHFINILYDHQIQMFSLRFNLYKTATIFGKKNSRRLQEFPGGICSIFQKRVSNDIPPPPLFSQSKPLSHHHSLLLWYLWYTVTESSNLVIFFQNKTHKHYKSKESKRINNRKWSKFWSLLNKNTHKTIKVKIECYLIFPQCKTVSKYHPT